MPRLMCLMETETQLIESLGYVSDELLPAAYAEAEYEDIPIPDVESFDYSAVWDEIPI